MQNHTIVVSDNFKKSAIRSILAISLFVLTYIILVALSLTIIFLCYYIAFSILTEAPSLFTLLIGLGLIVTSSMIFIFLFKYLFTSQKTDRTGFTEITEADQPELIKFINNIAVQVGTPKPKHIYLTPDVNAFVFYNSSFWSMFFPVKKNLAIGMGLIHSVSIDELKGIVAHEFGHFSQRSMRLGSYVYYVNKIVYNMLYNNTDFYQTFAKWGSIHGILSFFTSMSFQAVRAIQWLLQQLYKLINLNYMGLSREMEFHADEVASTVAGCKPITTSLSRIGFSSSTFEMALSFYDKNIKSNIGCKNIYANYVAVMEMVAQRNEIEYHHNLTWLDIQEVNRFNKSKLVIKDQWASHPSIEERISRINNLHFETEHENIAVASTLIKNLEDVQISVTETIFKAVKYEGSVTYFDASQFETAFKTEYEESFFPDVFNNYYNNYNIAQFDFQEIINSGSRNSNQPTELFSDKMVNEVYEYIGLKFDCTVLEDIANKKLKIKTFDYDGKKYKSGDAESLVSSLKKERDAAAEKILENDINIFRHFYSISAASDKAQDLTEMYKILFDTEKGYEKCAPMQEQVYNCAAFMHVTTPIEQINLNIKKLQKVEKSFKAEILAVLESAVYAPVLDDEIIDYYRKYTATDFIYFQNNKYLENEVEALFVCINNWHVIHSKAFYYHKKKLLEFEAGLEKAS